MFIALLVMAAVVIIMGIVLFLIIKKNISLVKAKDNAEYQTKKTIQNLDTLVDHTVIDDNIRHKQQVMKNKIIGAKNEKDSDAVINSMRNIFNNNRL